MAVEKRSKGKPVPRPKGAGKAKKQQPGLVDRYGKVGLAVLAVVLAAMLWQYVSAPGAKSKGKSRKSSKAARATKAATPVDVYPASTPTLEQEGVSRAKRAKILQRWNPVRHNYTRQLALDNSGKVFNLTTMGMDPPIFEIDNFLTPAECEHLRGLAGQTGFFKSDSTYFDGSNLGDENVKKEGMSLEEANKLFRHSEQTWLEHDRDPLLQAMMDRVMNLGLLPDQVRRDSEQMQVVKYVDHGHYESHYDSEREGLGPCCIDPVARSMQTGVNALQGDLSQRCRLCRMMTVLYYLEDTEEGGGTVFPLADTTDEELKEWENSAHADKYKQTRECGPGLVVKPKKGKAVMWYNHKIDRGYLGDLDKRSLHGGCNVIQGKKWISNHWMSALPHPDVPRDAATSHY